nr:uncharacterized protein LOC104111103 [Nicotiana tomentosiformis]
MEHFVDKNKIEVYNRFLGFQHGAANPNGQIWCFWNSQCDPIVIAEDDQQITLNIKDKMQDKGLYVTAVYAKCTNMERKYLWINIEDINLLIDGPWCIGGDFNTIVDSEEKLGGKPHRAYKTFNFTTTMEACGFSDIGFTGHSRGSSKSLGCAGYWECYVEAEQQTSRLGKKLSQWYRDKVGDIHQQVSEWEAKVHILEDLDIQLNSEHSREDLNKAHAEYTNWRRLHLHRTKNNKGRWVEGDAKIARTVIRHFSKLFNLSQPEINHNVLSCIQKCLTVDENAMLSKLPDESEIRNAVFSLSVDSTAGPNGYNGTFFQHSEVLSRSLNALNDNVDFIHFTMSHRGPLINHLAYADDIVIFTNGNNKSVKLIMKQISNYEASSGQKVNTDKSFFLTDPKIGAHRVNRMRECIGFLEKTFPFNNLGCPLYIGRNK